MNDRNLITMGESPTSKVQQLYHSKFSTRHNVTALKILLLSDQPNFSCQHPTNLPIFLGITLLTTRSENKKDHNSPASKQRSKRMSIKNFPTQLSKQTWHHQKFPPHNWPNRNEEVFTQINTSKENFYSV